MLKYSKYQSIIFKNNFLDLQKNNLLTSKILQDNFKILKI